MMSIVVPVVMVPVVIVPVEMVSVEIVPVEMVSVEMVSAVMADNEKHIPALRSFHNHLREPIQNNLFVFPLLIV